MGQHSHSLQTTPTELNEDDGFLETAVTKHSRPTLTCSRKETKGSPDLGITYFNKRLYIHTAHVGQKLLPSSTPSSRTRTGTAVLAGQQAPAIYLLHKCFSFQTRKTGSNRSHKSVKNDACNSKGAQQKRDGYHP